MSAKVARGSRAIASWSVTYGITDEHKPTPMPQASHAGCRKEPAAGARTRRNVLALVLAVGGVCVLTAVRLSSQPLGFVFAFANCVGFMLYVILGHRIANSAPGGGSAASPMSGIDQLGLSMLIAAVMATPLGIVLSLIHI